MIDEAAGILGMDPDKYTLRSLIRMRDGKLAEQWRHTASIMAMIANSVRDAKKKKKGYQWTDFYPMKLPKKQIPQREKVGIDVLKVFLRPENQQRLKNNGVSTAN